MPNPRVAIIGGGPAGLSAAYHLVKSGKPLDITIYQMGWRLGGKGATGRDANEHNRIEEHGIHLFSRMYFDTWQMMREVYKEAGDGAHPCMPVQTIEDAFEPSNTTYSVENVEGCWTRELGAMPDAEGDPWDEDIDTSKSEIMLGVLKQLVQRGRAGEVDSLGYDDLLADPGSPEFQGPAMDLHHVLKDAYQWAYTQYHPPKDGGKTPDSGSDQPLPDLPEPRRDEGPRQEGSRPPPDDPDIGDMELQRVMIEVDHRIQAGRSNYEQLRRQVSRDEHWKVHRALVSVDMGLALFHGLVWSTFWFNSFDLDDYDDQDFRDWLLDHGATKHTIDSAGVLSIANIVFAYPEGDTTQEPKLSAASWLNWVLRSVLGHGAYFQFFAAGTGETITLPIYKHLGDKGVKFQFFHRLKAVESTGNSGARTLEKLVFERQAQPVSGSYDPLVSIPNASGGMQQWCVWPNQPKWDALQHGQANKDAGVDYENWSAEDTEGPEGSIERVLSRGGADDDGFDYVVWAIPNSMIPLVGDTGMQAEWAGTVAKLPTTATQAIQLWLTKDTTDLGWPRGTLPLPTSRYASSGFPNPLSGMVAFDSLLAYESWPNSGPKGLIYLCGQFQVLTGHDTEIESLARVRQSASASLRLMGNFLTEARPPEGDRPDPQAIDFGYLYDPDVTAKGEQRLLYQYARANTSPTEAYVQAPAQSLAGRRHAWDAGYDNLVVAGDWMYNGLNLGAFESAVSGGKVAAFALTAYPDPVGKMVTFSFLHPRAQDAARAAVYDGTVPMIP